MARSEYQLWDLTTGNCAGAYDDEATALAEVRAGVREDGPDSFDGVALVRSTGRVGEIEDLGQGRALVARALGTVDKNWRAALGRHVRLVLREEQLERCKRCGSVQKGCGLRE